MEQTQKPVLTDLLSVSRHMAELASAGEWDSVNELKLRHQELVTTFFDGDGRGPLSAHVLSELTQVRVFTDLVLELAQGLFAIDMRDISRTELLSADEVFITGTSKGVVPVVKVDENVIGSGSPGPNTRRLMEAFRRYTERYADAH